MDEVEKFGKTYDLLCFKYNPAYVGIVRAIEIVKQFIRRKKLIIYGGTAIDMALRLKGSKIYPDEMLQIADLDFFSPDNVNDAYELCDILFKEFPEVRTIHGLHIQTMRVDIQNNIWIADISYCPKVLFDVLEYLEFDGMRVVHPNFQRIDIHKSLSFPYDFAPMEVAFNRYNKDLKRFNELDTFYPYTIDKSKVPPDHAYPALKFNIGKLKNYVMNGFLAYALIYEWMVQQNYNMDGLYNLHLSIGRDGMCECDIPFIDLIHMNIAECAREIGISNPEFYYPLHNFTPEKCVGVADQITYKIYSSKNKWVTVYGMKSSNEYYRIANYNYILLYFISLSLVGDDKKMMNVCRMLYIHMLRMANMYADRIDAAVKKYNAEDAPLQNKNVAPLFYSPLFVGSNYYGAENESEAYEILKTKFEQHIYDDIPNIPEPKSYYPIKGTEHPTFEYSSSKYFRQNGGIKPAPILKPLKK